VVIADAVTWTGLNVRDVTRLCRSLLTWNAGHPDDPHLWFSGRSRVEPEKNTVMIHTAFGQVRVEVGDTIVRRADGSFVVEAA
jgi:hypothetical protein